MKITKILGSAALAALALSLAACGASSGEATTAAASGTETTAASTATTAGETTAEKAESKEEAADAAASGEPVTVKLGVVGAIYEDLWTPAKEALKAEGIDLEFVQFADYVTPNNALDNGEIDLNAFQHRVYLENEVQDYGYKIENIGNTFIIPLNLYSEKVASVDELKDGDTVAIPDDVTNGGRALKVLEAAGLIKLKADAGFNPTLDDIESYSKQIKIEELKANTIPSALADVTAGIVNGNYALDFGLKTEEAIYQDSVLDEKSYWNLVAARTEDLSDPDKLETYRKVMKAFQSEATEKVFNDDFGGYFIAVGWDEDLLADK